MYIIPAEENHGGNGEKKGFRRWSGINCGRCVAIRRGTNIKARSFDGTRGPRLECRLTLSLGFQPRHEGPPELNQLKRSVASSRSDIRAERARKSRDGLRISPSIIIMSCQFHLSKSFGGPGKKPRCRNVNLSMIKRTIRSNAKEWSEWRELKGIFRIERNVIK